MSHTENRNNAYQFVYYPDFFDTLLENGNKIYTTYLNLSEFCSVVEKIERNIYNAPLPRNSKIDLKEFRKLERERHIYLTNLKRALNLIKMNVHEIYEITQDLNVIDSFIQALPETNCDIADFTVIECMKSIGITTFISDDKNFETVDGITLYTTYKDSHYTSGTSARNDTSQNGLRVMEMF